MVIINYSKQVILAEIIKEFVFSNYQLILGW